MEQGIDTEYRCFSDEKERYYRLRFWDCELFWIITNCDDLSQWKFIGGMIKDDAELSLIEDKDKCVVRIKLSDNKILMVELDYELSVIRCGTNIPKDNEKKHNEKTLKEKLINFIQRRGK